MQTPKGAVVVVTPSVREALAVARAAQVVAELVAGIKQMVLQVQLILEVVVEVPGIHQIQVVVMAAQAS